MRKYRCGIVFSMICFSVEMQLKQMYDFVEIMKNRQKLQCLLIFISACMMKRKFTVSVVYLYDKYILMSAYGKMAELRRITIILFGVCGKALKAK